MKTTKPKTQSPLVSAILALDDEMTNLHRVSETLGNLDIATDKGMKRALTILDQFNETRERIASTMSLLGEVLGKTGSEIEQVTKQVSERAIEIQKRQEQANALIQRFHMLGQKVAETTALVAEIGPELASQSQGDTALSVTGTLIEKLEILTNEAQVLREDAGQANMKLLVQNAHTLFQKLHSTSKCLKELPPFKSTLESYEPENELLH